MDRRIVDRSMSQEGADMVSWTITWLILALMAAILGFGGIASLSVETDKVLSVVFLSLSAIPLLFWRG